MVGLTRASRVDRVSALSASPYSVLAFGPFLPRDRDASIERLLTFLSSRSARSLRRVRDTGTGKYRSMRGSARDGATHLVTFSDAVDIDELTTELDGRAPSVVPIEITVADRFVGFRTLENADETISSILTALYGTIPSGPRTPLSLSTVRVESGTLRTAQSAVTAHGFHCETFSCPNPTSNPDALTTATLQALCKAHTGERPPVIITHLPANPVLDALPWSSEEIRHQFFSRFSDVPLGLNITIARTGKSVSVSLVDDSGLIDVHSVFRALAVEVGV